MIPRDEAWSRLLPHLAPLPAESLARRQAHGRVLAEPLTATVDVPPSDVSAMDGYALAGDHDAGSVLPVGGRITAGDAPGAALAPGTALRIMTGAPVPTGADRVIPFEATDSGTQRVGLRRPVAAGANVRRRGEVTAAGDPLLDAGAALTPEALALAAAHGHGDLAVHRAPRVAVLTTGDEVVPPQRRPAPGQIRDTHTDFLTAATARLGVEAASLGIAPDEPDALRAHLRRGLEDADVLLVCGGVSAGELDFVEDGLAELGCRPLFTSVAVQPGKPLVVAVREAREGGDAGAGRRLVFGLPGNPGSVMVTYHLFVRPALERLLGRRDTAPHDRLLTGVLAAPAPGAKGRDRYLPAAVEVVDGILRASPVAQQGSHDMTAHARGRALLLRPAHCEPAAAGEPCHLLLLD